MSSEPLFSETGPTRGVGAPYEIGNVDPRVSWIMKNVNRAEPAINKWRKQAREAYRFRDNKQLSDEDERMLRDQGRPNTAFNTAQKFIRYVSGVQRDSPTTLMFNAIDFDNTQAQLFGERVGKYYEWACKKSNADDSRATVFEDFLVTGVGFANCYITNAIDARGLIGYPRIDPMEMLWPDCLDVNLGGASVQQGGTRWRARESWVEKEEASGLFPSAYARSLIDAAATEAPQTSWPSVDRVLYKIPYVQTYPLDELKAGRSKSDRVKIMEFQCWENQPGYAFEDPLDQTEQWMDEEAFDEYKAQLRDLFHAEIADYEYRIGRKWLRYFLLNRRHLLEEPSELPGPRFTFNCMCCHFDQEDRIPYGFMRVLIDPQRYANKFFNQMIESFSKQAKGGAMAEVDAFEDKAQLKDFEDTYSQTGSVNFVAPGGMGKIKEKQQPETPAAAMAILQFCERSMQDVTGISEDSLGIGASTAAGVTLKRRQRAGMVLLASEFDSEAQFRRDEGYIFYDHLELISDSRLIRVGGAYDGEVMKLEGAPFSLDYEIELDDIERDPNMRQWLAEMVLGPFGQTAMRTGNWIDDFYNVLPIPRRWIEKIKAQAKQRQEQQQQMAAMGIPTPGGRGAKKSIPELQAIIENKKADTLLKQSKAGAVAGKGRQDQMRLMLDAIRQQMEEARAKQQHGLALAQGVAQIGMGAMKNGNNNGGPPMDGGVQ